MAASARTQAHTPGAGAVLLAAGASRRMGGQDKLLLPLDGQPLITYALAALQAAPSVEDVVLVVSRGLLPLGEALLRQGRYAKLRAVCLGGERRQDSVRAGLERLGARPWVVVHDGARPCVQPDLIERGLVEARAHGSAVAALPVQDTLKRVDAERRVTQTLLRDGVWAVQTPQVFPFDVLWRAHLQPDALAVTDDATLVERLGYPVHLYLGSPTNIKVTTADDVPLAEAILALARAAR